MPKKSPTTTAAKADKAPRLDPLMTKLVKYLEKQEGAVPLSELLLATLLRGLKKVAPKVRADYLNLIADDPRMVLSGMAEDEYVNLQTRAEAAAGEDAPPEGDDELQRDLNDIAAGKPAYVLNPDLDELAKDLSNPDGEIPVSTCLQSFFQMKPTKANVMRLRELVDRDGRLELVAVGVDTHVRVRVKTLGEMVEDATPKAQSEVAKPISPTVGNARVGDRLVHDTHGAGVVVDRTDISLGIKFDATGHTVLLDLRFAATALRFEDPATVTAAPISEAVPEVAQTITEEERQSNFHKALVSHAEAGREIARMHAAEKATEADQSEVLKATRKRIEDLEGRAMKHAAAMPTLEMACQRTIGFDVGPDAGTSGVGSGTATVATAGGFHQLPADQTVSLKDSGLTVAELHSKLFEVIKPGKSPRVKDFAVEVRGVVCLIRQASPDRTRWFLQQLVDKDAYEQQYAEKYGRAITDGDANAETRTARKAGGEDCGRTVKLAKKTLVLAPEEHGLVVVASKEAVDTYLRAKAPADEPDARTRAAGG